MHLPRYMFSTDSNLIFLRGEGDGVVVVCRERLRYLMRSAKVFPCTSIIVSSFLTVT